MANLRAGWGTGILVSVLLSLAVFLLNLVTIQQMVSLMLLLSGAWTVFAAFTIFEKKDRNYYSGWGVVVALLSLSYLISFQYALALILLAIIALIVVNVYVGKTPRVFRATTVSQAPAGETPAAS